jgi:hypothetical protein
VIDFFHPLFLVASWFVGIFGGFILGFAVVCVAVILFCIAIFVICYVVISLLDMWSSFSYRNAVRRARKLLNDIRE